MESANIFINYEELFILHRMLFSKAPSRLRKAEFLAHDVLELDDALLKLRVLNSLESCSLAADYHRRVLSLRSAGKIPLAITLTFDLLPFFCEGARGAEVSLALVRGLNQIVDASQCARTKLSFRDSLVRLGLPRRMADVVSETRHALTHKARPSADFLRVSVCVTLCFVKLQFWDVNLRAHRHCLHFPRLRATFANVNDVLDGRLHAEEFEVREQPPAPEAAENARVAAEVREALSAGCDPTELAVLIRRLKLRKLEFLTLAAEQVLGETPAGAKSLADYIDHAVTVADFRNAFANGKFRLQIYKVVCEQECSPAAQQLLPSLAAFAKILDSSEFLRRWAQPLRTEDADFASRKAQLELAPMTEILENYF